MGFSSFILSEEQRAFLLEKFPPRYPRIVAHHVTEWFDCPPSAIMPQNKPVQIIGIADNDHGIQALIATVDSKTNRESDGHPYHITWSLDKDKIAPAEFDFNPDPALRIEQPYRTFHSNRMISAGTWSIFFDEPIILGSMDATFED